MEEDELELEDEEEEEELDDELDEDEDDEDESLLDEDKDLFLVTGLTFNFLSGALYGTFGFSSITLLSEFASFLSFSSTFCSS